MVRMRKRTRFFATRPSGSVTVTSHSWGPSAEYDAPFAMGTPSTVAASVSGPRPVAV
ncbi:hypothetical protein COEX109129_10080 [Corallococcus exiguus]